MKVIEGKLITQSETDHCFQNNYFSDDEILGQLRSGTILISFMFQHARNCFHGAQCNSSIHILHMA